MDETTPLRSVATVGAQYPSATTTPLQTTGTPLPPAPQPPTITISVASPPEVGTASSGMGMQESATPGASDGSVDATHLKATKKSQRRALRTSGEHHQHRRSSSRSPSRGEGESVSSASYASSGSLDAAMAMMTASSAAILFPGGGAVMSNNVFTDTSSSLLKDLPSSFVGRAGEAFERLRGVRPLGSRPLPRRQRRHRGRDVESVEAEDGDDEEDEDESQGLSDSDSEAGPNDWDEVYIFLLRMTLALHTYGAPTHKTEYNVRMLIDRFSLDASVVVLPTIIIVSWGRFVDNTARTQIFPALPQSLNARNLQLLDELCDDVLGGEVDFHTATSRLVRIVSLPSDPYPVPMQIMAYSCAAVGLVGLYYNGRWQDVLCSALLGCLAGLMGWMTVFSPLLERILEAVTATFIAFFATLISMYITPVCVLGVCIASIYWLLPGLSLTIAVSELAARSLISGTVKLFYALIVAVELGFGLAVGERLAFYFDFRENPVDGNVCFSTPQIPLWVNPIFFVLASISLAMLTKAEPRQWPGMILCSFTAYALYAVAVEVFGMAYDMATVITCLAIGLIANGLSALGRTASVIPLIAGILLIVPGSIGVKGVIAMMTDDYMSGMAFGFRMVIVALAITVGVFVSNLVIPPTTARASHT